MLYICIPESICICKIDMYILVTGDKIIFVRISSLQCYSVLSTIAQVLRKMSLKILAS